MEALAKGVCSLEDCSRSVFRSKLCNKHFNDPERSDVENCSVPGCAGVSYCRNWCRKHYGSWQRNGDPLYLEKSKVAKSQRGCSVEGCDRSFSSRGWCQKHYENWRRFGDPLGRPSTKFDGEYDPVSLTKRCSGCLQVKSIDEYSPQVNGLAGKLSRCKPCVAEYSLSRLNSLSDDKRFSVYLRKFGITADDYYRMFEDQGGLCAICHKPETVVLHNKLSKLSVDHDHVCCPSLPACGKCVRGLLCRKHNSGIASFDDDPKLLQEAIDYLLGGVTSTLLQ